MENKKVTYSYSAIENEEIIKIRDKYIQPSSAEKSKKARLVELRRLDKIPHNRATIISVLLGVAGCFVFVLGMKYITALAGSCFGQGVLIGILGLCMMGSALPVYQFIVSRIRKKLAPKIIKMSEELLNQ